MWFKKLTGFEEISEEFVKNNIKLDGEIMFSKVNDRIFQIGKLSTPSLEELRTIVDIKKYESKIKISELVDDVIQLHCYKENNGALFQVASQFNLLEMTDPHITPEDGITRYGFDNTQGPACAISCGAATIYRNYFVNINDEIGQSKYNQINCLQDFGIEIGNIDDSLYTISNGYLMTNKIKLLKITDIIKEKSPKEYEFLKGKLRIGLQSDTEVTMSDKNIVSQVFCSGLPISYNNIETEDWEIFARLILEATYESVFYSAILNYEKTKNNKVYITLIGGGVFGNKIEWILESIKKSLVKFMNTPLYIMIVSYKNSNKHIQESLKTLNYDNKM